MSFRSASIKTNTNSSATSCIIDTPAGVVATDTLVAFLATGSQNEPITFTGWTRLGFTSASGVGPTCVTYIRAADPALPANYTFTWAGPETGLMGAIVAFSNSYSTTHVDGASFFNYSGGSPKTLTIPAHAVSVANRTLYATYCIPAGLFTGGTITIPPQTTLAVAGNWIPADIGGERAGMSVAYESLSTTSEPGRDFVYTWNSGGGNNLHGVAQRQVAVNLNMGLGSWQVVE